MVKSQKSNEIWMLMKKVKTFTTYKVFVRNFRVKYSRAG